MENSDFLSYIRSELTFQKVKKGLPNTVVKEHERTSDEEDIGEFD